MTYQGQWRPLRAAPSELDRPGYIRNQLDEACRMPLGELPKATQNALLQEIHPNKVENLSAMV